MWFNKKTELAKAVEEDIRFRHAIEKIVRDTILTYKREDQINDLAKEYGAKIVSIAGGYYEVVMTSGKSTWCESKAEIIAFLSAYDFAKKESSNGQA